MFPQSQLSPLRAIEVARVADLLIRKSLAVKPGEQVLVVMDSESDLLISTALASAARVAGAEPTIAIMGRQPKMGSTKVIDEAVKGADVVIGVTKLSIAHSKTIHKALLTDKSIRYLSLLGVTHDTFTRDGANVDPDELYEITERVVRAVNSAKRIRVTSALGMDLSGSLEGMVSKNSGGYARNPGDLMCFPDGEAWQGPTEGTAEGIVVIDKTVTLIGALSEPITFEVSKGKIVKVDGGKDAAKLRSIMQGVENIDNIAEIAIGTNPMAKFCGEIMVDKHVGGGVHIGFGDNIAYGGTTRCALHLDGVVSNPTVYLDDKVVVDNGRIVV